MNVASITYPSGRVVNYDHNAYGEPKSITGYVSSVNYHSTGQLASALFANGQAFESTKDDRSRPNRWALNGAAIGTVFNFYYRYDDRGNINGISNYFGPAKNLFSVTYDGLSRLKTANGFWNSGQPSSQAAYSYNAIGDITNKEIGGKSYGYTYNVVDGGKLSEVVTTGIGGEKQFNYDAKGNVTNNGINQFRYNQMNQMREIVADEGNLTGQKNVYDGNAMRVKTTKTTYNPSTEFITDSNTTYHVYSRSGLLLHEFLVDSQEARDHIYLSGKRIATRATHNNFDTDSDGIPDYFERLHGLPVNDPSNANQSSDGDSVSDLDEYLNDLIPTNRDTDGDGVDDTVVIQPPPETGRFDIDITPAIDFLLD